MSNHLLDAVVDYLPSPADVRSVSAHIDGAESAIEVTSAEPAAALVFKVVHDEQGRRMVFLRTYAGVLKKGDRVLNARTGRTARIGRLLRLFADRREDVVEAHPGDIVAAVGLKDSALETRLVIQSDRYNWNVRCSRNQL